MAWRQTVSVWAACSWAPAAWQREVNRNYIQYFHSREHNQCIPTWTQRTETICKKHYLRNTCWKSLAFNRERSLKDDQQHKYTEVTVSAWNRRTVLAYLQALFILGELIFTKEHQLFWVGILFQKNLILCGKKTVAWLQKSLQEWPRFVNKLVYYWCVDKYIYLSELCILIQLNACVHWQKKSFVTLLADAERDRSQSGCLSLSPEGDCAGKSSCLDFLAGMGSDA